MKKTAIVFALFYEFRLLARKLGFSLIGARPASIIAKNQDVALVRSGMGKQKARKAAEDVIRTFKPDVIISAGFCGALVEELKVGDIVVSDFKDGKLFCSDRILFTYAEKIAVFRRSKALVVDMESEGVAAAAESHGIDFLAVKAVSDGLRDDIPKIRLLSLRELPRFKRSLDTASGKLSEFLLDYIKKGHSCPN
ncbi:MAG: hypothetical protein V1933_05410 [Candidatus Omnitrophota bacterium]